MNESKFFSALMQQLTIAGFICTFYNLISSEVVKGFYPIMLFGFVLVIVPSVHLFLLKERTARSLIVLCSIIVLCAEVLVFILSKEKTVSQRLQAIPFLFFFSAYTVRRLLKGTDVRTMVRTFDVSILLMLSIGVYLAAHSLNLRILYPSLLSTFISFSSIIYLRQKEDGGTKNWAVTILSLLLSALIVYALVEYSSLLGKGVLAIQNWLLAIGNAFLRFVNWLFSLIPRLFNVEDDGVLEWETDEQYRGNYELNGIIDKRILELIVIAIIVIIAFFTLLYFMKFLKVGGEKRAKKVLGEKRKGPGLLSALRRAFISILSAIRVKLYIMRNKNNTKGLYFYLINRLKRDEERKMPGETAKEFLIRLSYIYELGDIREDLIALSEKINVAFYAEQPSLDDTSLSNAVAIRKKVNMFRVCRALTSLWNNLINSIKNYRSKKEVG